MHIADSTIRQWLTIVGWVSVAGMAAVVVRMAVTRLYAVYPWFCVFISADLLVAASALLVPMKKNVYAYFYFGSTALMMLLSVAALRELYQAALEGHPAIAKAARWMLYASLVGACVFVGVTAGVDFSNPAEKYPQLRLFLAMERSWSSVLSVMLLAFTVFLAWFPVKVRKNIVFYWVGLAILLLANSGLLLARNLLGPEWLLPANLVRAVASASCYLLWAVSLRPSYETDFTDTGHQWNPEEAERLRIQLNQINDALARKSARRDPGPLHGISRES